MSLPSLFSPYQLSFSPASTLTRPFVLTLPVTLSVPPACSLLPFFVLTTSFSVRPCPIPLHSFSRLSPSIAFLRRYRWFFPPRELSSSLTLSLSLFLSSALVQPFLSGVRPAFVLFFSLYLSISWYRGVFSKGRLSLLFSARGSPRGVNDRVGRRGAIASRAAGASNAGLRAAAAR